MIKFILAKKQYIYRLCKEKKISQDKISLLMDAFKQKDECRIVVFFYDLFHFNIKELLYLEHKREYYFKLFIIYLKSKNLYKEFIDKRRSNHQIRNYKFYSYKILPEYYINDAFPITYKDEDLIWRQLNYHWIDFINKKMI